MLKFKYLVLIIFISLSTRILAHEDSCVTKRDTFKDRTTLRATYDIRCRGYYYFSMNFKFKEYFERKVQEGNNRYIFFDPHNGGKQITDKARLLITKKIYIDGEKIEESNIQESFHMGALGISTYTFKKKLLSFKITSLTIELEIQESENFLKRFDIYELTNPSIRHLFSLGV